MICEECSKMAEESPCLNCRINEILSVWKTGILLSIKERRDLVLYKVRNPIKYRIEVPEELRLVISVKMRAYEKTLREAYNE